MSASANSPVCSENPLAQGSVTHVLSIDSRRPVASRASDLKLHEQICTAELRTKICPARIHALKPRGALTIRVDPGIVRKPASSGKRDRQRAGAAGVPRESKNATR
ncbi:hypothetical protein [Roseivivax sediminis]|uniref:Uncharacterized protein n=1 Tax=Roseivivax sediminis TaxID=936889 RepID=A0A1I1VMU2_9RHOB|nr:hypothetical protein [Roseivivax sediminis]SFD84347.1 hypothetical protein SAMN04515678_103305 [Roseivivax sediminis]